MGFCRLEGEMLAEFIRKIIRKTKDGTIIDAVKIKIHSRLYFNINSEYEKTIFLASAGRSGSTWVSNLINFQNKYRYMFEPFHSNYVNICKDFNYRQYLQKDNSEEKYLLPAQQIISGKIRDKWIDRFNRKLVCNERLIKDIRANLLLGWLNTHFPEMKIILLFRHPLAVVNSRMKLGWGSNIKFFLEQENLINDYIEPFIKQIKTAKSVFEEQVFAWCIESYVSLKQFNKGDIHLAFYEDFITKPKETIKSLFNYLNIEFKDKIMTKLHIPSPEVRDESAIITGENLTDKWKNNFDKQQIEKAVEILSLFGLDEIYSEESLPKTNNIFKIFN